MTAADSPDVRTSRVAREVAYAEAIRKSLAIPAEVGRWATVLAEVVAPLADAERNEAYARGYQAAREHWKARADAAEAERDALRDRLAKVEALLSSPTLQSCGGLDIGDDGCFLGDLVGPLRELLAAPVTGDTDPRHLTEVVRAALLDGAVAVAERHEDAQPDPDDGIYDPDCTCGLPVGHEGDCR